MHGSTFFQGLFSYIVFLATTTHGLQNIPNPMAKATRFYVQLLTENRAQKYFFFSVENGRCCCIHTYLNMVSRRLWNVDCIPIPSSRFGSVRRAGGDKDAVAIRAAAGDHHARHGRGVGTDVFDQLPHGRPYGQTYWPGRLRLHVSDESWGDAYGVCSADVPGSTTTLKWKCKGSFVYS